MQMKLMKGRNFLAWKWKNLRRRREYFFCLFNLLLAFIWISIGALVNDDSYNFHGTYHTQPFAFTALIVFCLHLFYFCSFLYPAWFRRIIHGKPKMTYFTYLSFLVGAWILVFLRHNELNNDGNAAIIVLFVLTIDAGIAVLHHMGLANPYMVVIKSLSFVSLLIFLGFTKFPAPVVFALLISFFIHHCNGVVIEQELTRTFMKLDFLDQNPEEYGISKEFSKDFLKALTEIDTVLLRQLRELNFPAITNDLSHDPFGSQNSEKSLVRQSSSGSSRVLLSLSQSQKVLPLPTLKLFHFNKTMTDCLEMKYLKNALFHSITSSCNVDKNHYDKFYFHKMTRFIFSLLESSSQHSLPLFVANISKEVMISAPLELFQLILYLLLHDYVKGRKAGICYITCENNNDLWELHLKSVYREVTNDTSIPTSDRSKANSSNGEEEEDPNAVATAGGAGKESVEGTGNNNPQPMVSSTTTTDLTDGPVVPPPNKKEKAFPPTLVVPNLMADRHPIEDSTSMERLADRIFYKYFRTRIEKSAVEVKEGVNFYHKVVPLSRSYFTISEKPIPPTAATAAFYGSSAAAVSVESLRLSFAIDSLAESQWIIVGSKVHESGLLPYLKEKFQLIYLPVMVASMDEYRNLLSNTGLLSQQTSSSSPFSSTSGSFRSHKPGSNNGTSNQRRHQASPRPSHNYHPSHNPYHNHNHHHKGMLMPHALHSEILDTDELQQVIKKNLFVLIPESHLSKLHPEHDLPYLRAYYKELIIICDLSPFTSTTLAAINHRYEIHATYLLKAKPSLLELLNLVQMMSARVEARGVVHDEHLPRLFCLDDRINNDPLGKTKENKQLTETAREDEEDLHDSAPTLRDMVIPTTSTSPPLLPLPLTNDSHHSSSNGRNSPATSTPPATSPVTTANQDKKHPLKKGEKEHSLSKASSLKQSQEYRQQWISLMVKLQSNITSVDASRSIVMIKKMIDHRLSVLHHPERGSPRAGSSTSSFNYPLLQTYLAKRKFKSNFSSASKQKAEFISSFFLPFVTVMNDEWRQHPIHFPIFLPILEEMIRQTKLFRLSLLTLSAEALYDIFACLKTALIPESPARSLRAVQNNNNNESTDEVKDREEEDQMTLYETKESNEELTPLNTTSTSTSKFQQYLYNIQNQVQVPDRTHSFLSSQILLNDSECDSGEITDRLMAVIRKYRETGSQGDESLLSPLLREVIEDGLNLLRSAVWEAAFDE